MSKQFLAWFLKTIFAALFAFYIFFSLMEEFRKGFVSDYFNPHWLLAAAVVAGILMLLAGNGNHSEEKAANGKKPRFLIFISAVVIWVMVWQSAWEFEFFWRLILSFFGVLATAGILLVLFDEQN